jgi:hypothetical protein
MAFGEVVSSTKGHGGEPRPPCGDLQLAALILPLPHGIFDNNINMHFFIVSTLEDKEEEDTYRHRSNPSSHHKQGSY